MVRLVVVLLALVVTGCGTPAADRTGLSGDITVFAAASLTESFTELGKQYEQAHDGANVVFNFGASSALAKQLTEGAPADVFAAASPATMAQVSDSATVFVRNKLMIAVPEGNPGGIKDLADFADDARKIALCAAEVPCGAAARKAFDAAGITAKPDTLERDVKAVLTKVELGEVDAALVYRTDVRAAGGKVEGIEFPEADKAINDYPIVVLKDATNAEGGKAFVDFVLSAEGVAVLTKAGFERP